MTKIERVAAAPLFLGIEGGGTRTIAVLADEEGRLLQRMEFGPANLKLLSDVQLGRLFRSVAESFAAPSAVGLGMAGVRDAEDCHRLLTAAGEVWPCVPCSATHDLESALLAAERTSSAKSITRVIVLSGTGSCCYGRAPDGRTAKVGGWGHMIGDKASGYEIGLRALKAVVYYFDRDGIWSPLGQRILRVLQLNEPNDLIGWAQQADKREIAALALEVFAMWNKGEKIAADILTGAAHSLAKDGATCAKRLAAARSPVEFVFAGSVLLKQPRFAKMVGRQLLRLWPNSRSNPLAVESVWGAVELASREFALWNQTLPAAGKRKISGEKRKLKLADSLGEPASKLKSGLVPESFKMSPTEMRNSRSLQLDKLPLVRAVRLMMSEEAKVPPALLAEENQIARAIGLIVRALTRGGRLFYVGAGTSGRLGVLDASECPPTFRAPADQVQGIIAGGQKALWASIEGAEDDAAAGGRAIQFRDISRRDVVVGIAASGRTPFVWGALDEAKRRKAKTVLICFNPYLRFRRSGRPDLVIAPNLGPEVLTGSSRLKAGTATKLILNMFTTLAMVRLGKVVSNLMVDLNPSNSKLRDRAVRILRDLSGADAAAAQEALEKSGWVVKSAWKRLKGRR
jgi:N-acetylmuramic acid 6-phosphate etherase